LTDIHRLDRSSPASAIDPINHEEHPKMTNTSETLTHRDWQLADWSQSACNLSGLAHDLAKVVTKIWAEARQLGEGTDYVNTHPIVRLYVEQMVFLASGRDYWEAANLVRDKLAAFEAAAATSA
jgi:hypothetical protein